MLDSEAIKLCHKIVKQVGADTDQPLRTSNLLDYLGLTVDVVKSWGEKRRSQTTWMGDFLRTISILRDDGERIVSRDPVILYKPQHHVSLAFHQSLAKYRYFHGANRISKTVAGYVDDAWLLTGRHPYRRNGQQGSVFIIGSDYEKYAPNVFETKMLRGEVGNPVSPLFPEGGRWLHHYDYKRHILYIACKHCAYAGKAQNCTHVKYACSLFSDKADELSLAGGQYAGGHLDEPVIEPLWNEAQQRVTTVKGAGIVITETPKWGEAWWSYQTLYKLGIKGPPENFLSEDDCPIVSLHNIDRLTAGLTSVEDIIAMMRTMPEHEIRCRILGQFVSASETSIFDLVSLAEMERGAKTSTRGELILSGERGGKNFEEVAKSSYEKGSTISFVPHPKGNLQIYDPPIPGRQYVIGADVAFGLTKGDPSAAIVHMMTPVGEQIALRQVASYHGWVGALPYADALFRLGLYYNTATLVIESNGPGLAVIQRLFDALGCWFLFRDVTNPASATMDLAATYGINTNIRTKPMMIAVLQSKIRAHAQGMPAVTLVGREEIEEHRSFIQEMNQTGQGFKMKGAGKTHDDFVMANALGVYAAIQHPIYDHGLDARPKKEVKLSEHEKAVWKNALVERASDVNDERSWY